MPATSLGSNSGIGVISFSDTSGGEFGLIGCFANGATGSNDYPGRLEFHTTADGAPSPTERMRITSTGSVGIGTTNPAYFVHAAQAVTGGNDFGFRAQDTTNNKIVQLMRTGSTYSYIGIGGTEGVVYSDTTLTLAADGSNPIKFSAGSQERMRIDTSGRLLVGTSSNSGVSSNTAPVLAGNFVSFQGNISATSGVATTLFTLDNLNSNYFVSGFVPDASDAAGYNCLYFVGTNKNNSAVITVIKAGTFLTLSLSGMNLQATQTSGSINPIYWSVTRVANIVQ